MSARPDLSRWTPVAIDVNGAQPSIDWCDMRGERFGDPFFGQTVARLTDGAGARPVVRTPLSALAEFDGEPSLDPSGLVFHIGRCGSTLVARLLGLVSGVLAVREPQPINSLLEAEASHLDEAQRVETLRLLVRALGRVRFGDERRFILKLSSWNVCSARLFLRAFPGVPVAWIQRRPVEVMASMMKAPPGWLALRNRPLAAARMFGVEPGELTGVDGFEFAARLLAAMFDGAEQLDACVVDYLDLPGAVPDVIAPHFGISLDESDRAAMADLARYHAKAMEPVPFSDDSAQKRAVPERALAVSSALLEGRYGRLDDRRVTSHGH